MLGIDPLSVGISGVACLAGQMMTNTANKDMVNATIVTGKHKKL